MIVGVIAGVIVGVGEFQGVGRFVLHMLKYFAQRDATFCSRLAAVFIFRGDARLSAGEGCDFNPDPAEFGFHGLASPGKGVPLNVLAAHSKGGTFVENWD